MRPYILVASTLLALVTASSSCVKTGSLANQFNEGVLESGTGDPFHDPDERAVEIVKSRMKAELIDGYFGQQGEKADVVQWMLKAKTQCGNADSGLRKAVLELLCSEGRTTNVDCSAVSDEIEEINEARTTSMAQTAGPLAPEDEAAPPTPASTDVATPAPPDAPSPPLAAPPDTAAPKSEPPGPPPAQMVQQRIVQVTPEDPRKAGEPHLVEWLHSFLPTPKKGPACLPGDKPNEALYTRVSDLVRFRVAVARGVRAVAPLITEGFVTLDELVEGAEQAFAETAVYLKERQWRRETGRKTLGLTVKGGASTGLFSAGVVWVALNLINECMEDARCKKKQDDFRFQLLSGTSTGAMVITAVDLFNSGCNHAERAEAMRKLAGWFTCSTSRELYCVQDRLLGDLIQRDGRGLLMFDGITKKLRREVGVRSMRNPSEAIYNVVDFRSARLFELSDQDRYALHSPEDVAKAAYASAALPFIVEPISHLPVDHESGQRFAHLDGGIRSELPIIPLVRRGAERSLVVSSSASVVEETSDIPNGLSMAIRFIDVVVGGVMERDIELAKRTVESMRLAELMDCDRLTRKYGLEGDRLCAGDISRLCGDAAPQTLTRALGERWKAAFVFRDPERVPSLPGYNFKPKVQRQLFLSGAEAARARCREIAEVIGIDVTDEKLWPDVVKWCAPRFEPLSTLCGGERALEPDPPIACEPKRKPGPELTTPWWKQAQVPACPN